MVRAAAALRWLRKDTTSTAWGHWGGVRASMAVVTGLAA